MPADAAMMDYYARRAGEYERIYRKPERQADLASLRDICAKSLAGHRILELACGTGYWTQAVSQTAKSILATDASEEVLHIARAKPYGCDVSFQQADAFDPDPLASESFTAGMAMFWWSHLRKSEIRPFLAGFHRVLPPGALLVFMDNRFVAGSSTPISRTDEAGNTYQLRGLDSGSTHEVLKNFPAEKEVRDLLAGLAKDVCWTELPYYWVLSYRVSS